MKVIPFTVEHGLSLDVGTSLRMLHDYTKGPSYTLIVDDKVVCSFGVIVMWEGVGVAWGMLGPDFAKHVIFVTRSARRMIRDVQCSFNLDRIEAQSTTSEGGQWLRLVGFEREYGVARKYVNKQDAIRFEMIRSDND